MRHTLTCLCLLLSIHAFSKTWYVNKNAFGANDGSSWANAFTHLRWALGVAANGDSIKVAAGTYLASSSPYGDSTFVIPAGISFLGGYPKHRQSVRWATGLGQSTDHPQQLRRRRHLHNDHKQQYPGDD